MTTAIAVGDSITRTGGAIVSPEVEPLSWSQRVAAAEGWELDTFAQSGAATSVILGLVPKQGSYDVALTCVGTNDVLSPRRWNAVTFRRDVASLLAKLNGMAAEVVVLGLVPNVGRLPSPLGYGFGLKRRVDAAHTILREETATVGATFVAPAALSRPVEYFGDCVHPTSIGHIRLANEVLAALGRPAIEVECEPSREFLTFTNRRLVKDTLTRPAIGVASSVLALIGR